jgi:thiol-disulfide isomerase/thioredoxin
MRHTLLLFSLLVLPALAACSGAPAAPGAEAQIDGRGLVGVDLDGKSHSIDSAFAQGKWVTLVFWQDWCGSCLAEAPHVQDASRAYADRIAFYGVVSGADQTEKDFGLRNCVRELGLTYPQIRDRSGTWSLRFQVSSTPTVLVFSPNGVLRFRGNHLPESWNNLLAE